LQSLLRRRPREPMPRRSDLGIIGSVIHTPNIDAVACPVCCSPRYNKSSCCCPPRAARTRGWQSSERKATNMANSSTDTIPGRFEVKATASDHFSWLRTRLSVERTMMSWVRTATALIGFGFTIVQFFERMQAMPGVAPAYFPGAPRYLGLALIFCGIMALVISIWEYHWGLHYLWGGNFAVIAGVTREGKANADVCSGDRPRLHRCIRVLRRAAAYGVAVRGEDRSRSRFSIA